MLSNMQVFNTTIAQTAVEVLAQQVEKFNAASNGAIVMTTEGFDGDFLESRFFSDLSSTRRRVDRYAAQASVSPTALAQVKEARVKIAGGFGPILFEPSQMTYINQSPELAGAAIVEQMVAAIMQDQLNTAIAALCAAISNQAGATNDVSATAGLDYSAINTSMSKFGDSSSNLVAHVITGEVFHRLVGQNLANTAKLFVAGNVTVVSVLGRPFIVTDAPALYVAGTPNKQRALTLASGAAIVHNNGDLVTNVQTTNGNTRIESTFQSDYTFGLGLKGYTWDETNGGKSPTDAEIATGSNWDKTATDIKSTAGVIAIGDAAK